MFYDDVHEINDRRITQTTELLEVAIQHLLPEASAVDTQDKVVVILDPLRAPRTQVVTIDRSIAKGIPSAQHLANGSSVALVSSDAHGLGSVETNLISEVPRAERHGDEYILRNANICLAISGGRITSLRDVNLDRELIASGPGAETAGLMIYDDLPLAYDAWDAEIYHLDRPTPLMFHRVEVVDNGPLRASIRTTTSFGASQITLLISLDAVSKGSLGDGVQVEVSADWHETHKFLKSKFEVCAHMIADLSEAGYGVSLVSEFKYGYAVEGNVMRFSMLRSATAPDPEQDQGHHEFSFAIMPHQGRLLESGVYQQALQFINPVSARTVTAKIEALKSPFAITGADSVILDTVKRGEDDVEDGQRSVGIRMFESLGGRSRGALRISGDLRPTRL